MRTTRGGHSVTPFFGLRPPKTIVGRLVNRVARAMIVSGSRKGVETFNAYLAEEGLPPVTVEDYFDWRPPKSATWRECRQAFSSSAITIFFWPIITWICSGRRVSSPMFAGMTCQLTPNRSLHHPHCSDSGTCESFDQ